MPRLRVRIGSPEIVLDFGENPNCHIGFPSATFFKGSIYLAVRLGSDHVSSRDGKIVIYRFTGGCEVERVSEISLAPRPGKEVSDLRDPVLASFKGHLVLFFFRYPEDKEGFSQSIYVTSGEDGQRWEPPRRVFAGFQWLACGRNALPYRGELLFPVYGKREPSDPGASAFLVRTRDLESFEIEPIALAKPGLEFLEPSIAPLGGKLICFLRTNVHRLFVTGKTGGKWSRPRPTRWFGHCPFVFVSFGRPFLLFRDVGRYIKRRWYIKVLRWRLGVTAKPPRERPPEDLPLLPESVVLADLKGRRKYTVFWPPLDMWEDGFPIFGDCGYPTAVEVEPGTWQVFWYWSPPAKGGKPFRAMLWTSTVRLF